MSITRTERGWPGHFICGHECAFRRNTLLECGDRRIVISTVGNMRRPYPHGKAEMIGHERHYETMAFEAKFQAPYWEADVTREIRFDSEWAISVCENDTDLQADLMHEAVVAELTAAMRRAIQ